MIAPRLLRAARALLLVVALATPVALGCGASDPGPETLGVASSAVGNIGTIDSTNIYEYVGALTDPPSGGRFASGILVTPFWVLTVRHAFINAGHDVDDAIDVVFHFDPAEAPAGDFRRFAKDPAENAMVRSTIANDKWNDDEISRDIALVRLQRPVKHFIAAPHHPSLVADVCGDDWDGHIVGFGNGASICPDTTPVRRFILAEGYSKSVEDFGAVYHNNWTGVPGEFCEIYAGHGGGDSGGPILKNDSGETLCGVCSVSPGWLVGPYWNEQNKDPAVDSQQTIDWLVDRIIDTDGNFDGECGAPTAQNDPDGDGIPSLCDSCPFVHNPEQLTLNDDPDGDGIGEACDTCPGLAVSDQSINCNYETELALAYPGASQPPVLRLSDFPNSQAFFDAKEAMLAAFRPDACDPVPCPRTTLKDGGDLPQSELPGISAEQANDCLLWGCGWEYSNRILVNPLASPPILAGSPPSTTATTGLRWCQCESSAYTVATFAGRLECQGGSTLCVVNETAFTSSVKWKPIVTRADQGWADPNGSFGIGKDIGRTWQVTVQASGSAQQAFWDFIDLGAPYVHQPYPGQAWVKGVLWGHFVDLATSYPTLPTAWVPKYGNGYTGGEGRVEIHPNGPDMYLNLEDYLVCDDCPFGNLDLFGKIGNPEVWGAADDGLVRVVPGSALRTFYDDVLRGTLKYVGSAEPPGRSWWASGGSARLKGVALNGSGAVTRLLVVEGGHEAMSSPSIVSITGGPTLRGNEGLVVSGSLRRFFVFGGTANGTPTGTPNADAWALDGTSQSWTRMPLAATDRTGSILAATYLIEDKAVYFIERVSGTLYLKRWQPLRKHPEGGAVRTLASLPAGWDGFARFWLAAGGEGDLLFAGAEHTDPHQETLLARFAFDASRRLNYAGKAVDTAPSVTVPSLTAAAVGYSIQQSGVPRRRSIAISAFSVGSDVPVIF